MPVVLITGYRPLFIKVSFMPNTVAEIIELAFP